MFDLLPSKKRFNRDMVRFRDEMDNLFQRFFDMDFPVSRRFFGEGDWAPRVDISEAQGEITVKAEIPGCEAKDIDVKLEGRLLVISGEKKQGTEENEENYHRVERTYGKFSRMLELPVEVNQEDIDATYKKGVLKLIFKKTEAADTKKIEIKAG